MKHSEKVHHLLGASGHIEIKKLKPPQRTIEGGIRKNKARKKKQFIPPVPNGEQARKLSMFLEGEKENVRKCA